MTRPRILIAYASTFGQTAKIARYIADVQTETGNDVTLVDTNELPRFRDLPHGQSPRDFDAVVVGSSVLYSRHHRSVRAFAAAHHDALNAMPSAFFSVSGSAASPDPRARAEAETLMSDLQRQCGWHPTIAESIAGAMAFTKYSLLIRWILKRISARQGGPTDTSRDHELTDWVQVRRFAAAVADAGSVAHAARQPLSA
jgi:menaquinone-dependent protoporphyrinogen oxidase